MSVRLEVVVLLVLAIMASCSKDAFRNLVAYQYKQRQMAELQDAHYHLLPFRIMGQPQHFLQIPVVDEMVSVDVGVHWMRVNSSLTFPAFDLTQKVRIIIQEETLSSAPAKAVLTREFLTQTGFRFNITEGKRYRWRIQSSGKFSKLVEIAVSSKPMQVVKPQIETRVSHHYREVKFLQEMTATLTRVKRQKSQRSCDEEEAEKSMSSMWAWMSSVEILGLFGFVMVQLSLFEKFMLPSSIV